MTQNRRSAVSQNGCCGYGLPTFADPVGNGQIAPIPDLPAIAPDQEGSVEPASSPHNADFASLSDFREIALAETQICPDDSGWVAVGRIEQID
jgi:hypothetical protein